MRLLVEHKFAFFWYFIPVCIFIINLPIANNKAVAMKLGVRALAQLALQRHPYDDVVQSSAKNLLDVL